MPGSRSNAVNLPIAGVLGLALVGVPLVAAPASAAPDGSDVVISEAYLNGGSAGATFTNKFVELYNPTDAAIDLSAYSLQYRAAGGTANPTSVLALTGSIPAEGHYLVQGGSNAANGVALPTPDVTSGAINLAGAGGTVFLVVGTTALAAPPTGSLVSADDTIVDLLGYGTSNTFETTAAPAASVSTTISRAAGTDTDVNSADFTAGAPTPTNAAGETEAPDEPVDPPVDPPVPGEVTPIADIQGTTDTSPLAGQTVTTEGVVIADHSVGGYNGYYIQTPGSGGEGARTASDGVFIYDGDGSEDLAIGDLVEVTGAVSEYFGLTQVDAGLTSVEASGVELPAATPLAGDITGTEREAYEGMLVAPAGTHVVAASFQLFNFGTLWLVPGERNVKSTELERPGAAATAIAAQNRSERLLLDDGYSIQVSNAAHPGDQPYYTAGTVVREGDEVVFPADPYVLSYGFDDWRLQPTTPITSESPAAAKPTFESLNPRPTTVPDVGGDIQIAAFNVLNYFTTFTSENSNARGAANAELFAIQKGKIVAAINALDADVVALQEIENSVRLGKPVDSATADLVAGLNAAVGAGTWDYVRTPAALDGVATDFITNAIIYRTESVETVGESQADIDESVWFNAREPIAQTFEADGTEFTVIANHFKSKSGDGAEPADGQGQFNTDRVAQANALIGFTDDLVAAGGTENIFLMGDFNSYSQEDPIATFAEAGWTDLAAEYDAGYTYTFDGEVGSLDHVLASPAAADLVTDTAVWNINSPEWGDRQYNFAATEPGSVFRSSDHDPTVVGLDVDAADVVDLNLLNINDFHGRIDENTVKFAGTIEQLREEGGEGNTLFLSSGDNIGASLFASSSQEDVPTLEVLNALLLRTSAVGNHEFDGGYVNLVGPGGTRESGPVVDIADFSYLGANVYNSDGTPALQEYDIFEVDGVRVAVIGAVTQETPTLVSPSGIAGLTFGDPVEAVNRVVDELVADDAADVFIAEYHEGASAVAAGDTIEDQLAVPDSAFTSIVNETSAEVDAIFNGHTHQQYAWDAPVPGEPGVTRPVLQTGSYGANIGQIVLSVDTETDEVVDYTARNVPRLAAPEGETDEETDAASAALDAELVAEYPRVAEVQQIVNDALEVAAEIGNQPVAEITADITTAYADGARDDRGSESTLGNLVADSLLETLSSPELGGAEIGVANPGGLRADLLYESSEVGEGDGIVTFAEANAVLPFVNNLYTTTLTGEQFRTVLEQQWQTDAEGDVPSRPFLNLGLSDNVTYTFDPDAAQGEHITGIFIDGEPIDPAGDYRIGSFSFLLEGGDNFREFAEGTDQRDSGLIDRDAWIEYLSTNSPVSPSFDRRGVAVTGAPTAALAVGADATVDLAGLDLTSLGSPANTTVSAVFEGSSAAPITFPVTGGAASVSFTVPDDALPAGTDSGTATLVITAPDSGTEVRVSVEVAAVDVPVEPGTGGPGTPGTPGDDGVGSGNGDDDLAFTGSDIGSALALGTLLLLLGAGFTAARVRSRRGVVR